MRLRVEYTKAEFRHRATNGLVRPRETANKRSDVALPKWMVVPGSAGAGGRNRDGDE